MNGSGIYRHVLFRLAVPLAVLSACASELPQADSESIRANAPSSPRAYEVVDCLLPGKLHRLGGEVTYVTPRRPVRTTEEACIIRGGEYVAYDRANYATALRVWQEAAERGDADAQTHVGEIYEKGLGTPPDYARAAAWYQKAADKGYARALTNLAYLYEKGLGVDKDPQKAVNLYRRAVGLPETVALAQGGGSEELRTLRKALESAHRKLQDTESEVRRAQATAAQKGQAVERLEQQLKNLQNNSGEDKATLREIKNELSRSKEDINRFKTQAADAEEQAKQYRVVVAKLEAKITVPAPSPAPQALNLGIYSALVIGNQHYQYHTALNTALKDAEKVAAILRKKYQFKVQVLQDADYATTMRALYDTANRLGEQDNLLVYFAGHGEVRNEISRGYWLPVDAGKQLDGMWVSTGQINDILAISKAKHILVVVDSCYAGALVRTANEIPTPANPNDAAAVTEWVRRMAQARSRNALTSGGLTPVVDNDAGGGNSIFARAFLDVLESNNDVLSGYSVWEKLAPRVTAAASRLNVPQKPEYHAMFGAGHDSGEFFFAPASRAAAASARWAARELLAPAGRSGNDVSAVGVFRVGLAFDVPSSLIQ